MRIIAHWEIWPNLPNHIFLSRVPDCFLSLHFYFDFPKLLLSLIKCLSICSHYQIVLFQILAKIKEKIIQRKILHQIWKPQHFFQILAKLILGLLTEQKQLWFGMAKFLASFFLMFTNYWWESWPLSSYLPQWRIQMIDKT